MANYSVSGTWMAAAWGHCRNGNHEEERRCRNVARMWERKPPLTDRARCLIRAARG